MVASSFSRSEPSRGNNSLLQVSTVTESVFGEAVIVGCAVDMDNMVVVVIGTYSLMGTQAKLLLSGFG